MKLAAIGVAGFAVLVPSAPSAEQPQDYIVVLKSSFKGSAAAVARQRAGTTNAGVGLVFEHALKGFVLRVSPTVAGRLADHDGRIAYVERDAPVQATTTQAPATWGLDRIDQHTLPLSNSFSYAATGAGVTAYVIDSGIRYSHTEFGGRAVFGFDTLGGNGSDCNGHGTHVAGTLGGSTYGVAKAVKLVSVRVLSCSGSGSIAGVIAGVDWVTAQHVAGAPAVANMSLTGGTSTALDTAVANSIADGVTYAVAAGNAGVNACAVSPARVAAALTIGATDDTDTKASWSNYGDCVDWFAPGVSITSAWSNNDTATNTISGTSMATPHTAGAAALYLQGQPAALPAAVSAALFAATTKDVVLSSRTVNDHLLYNDGGATLPPPPPPPPPPPIFACSNGLDDDGDLKIDYPADPGCTSATDNDEFNAPTPPPTFACSNGKDDDGDLKIDYPADPGCTSATDNDEFNAPTPPPTFACSNGKDDDGDLKIDYPADPGCTSPTDSNETDPAPRR